MEKRMRIEGMRCVHCKSNVEKALMSVPGVTDVTVDLETKTARIITECGVEDSVLMDAVKAKGFEPVGMI